MKIGTPELKTKPATKYFEHGYVSFHTENKELFYKVYRVTKTNQALIEKGKIIDENHLKALLALKSIDGFVRAMQ